MKEEYENERIKLLDKIDRVQREADGWKRATERNGISGFVLGAMVFFWVGYLAAFIILK